jgi:hypothetical protein
LDFDYPKRSHDSWGSYWIFKFRTA